MIRLREVNWIGDGFLGTLPATGLDVAVRLRSTRPPVPAVLHREGDGARVELCRDEDAVSPGQACVFYSSTQPQARVLGGGFIEATQQARPPTSDRT